MAVRFQSLVRGARVPALLLLVASCGGDSTGPGGTSTVPGSFTASVSMPANGVVGTPAGASPTVVLRDRRGQPVAGTAVTFEVTAGGGALTRTSATTDAQGSASAGTWTLGIRPGTNTVVARSGAFPAVTFQTVASPGAPASITATTALTTSGIVSQLLAPTPAVRLADSFDNPVPGAIVDFAVTGGGGSITGGAALSGTDGVARVGGWTLGAAPGPNTLTATTAGLAPVVFAVSGTSGPATSVLKVAGDDQSAAPGYTVPVRPTVRVTDAGGNGVAGLNVVFSVVTGGGSLTGAVQQTDLAGYATVGSWTLGTVDGPNTLTATVNGVGSATFTATAVTGTATSQYHIDIRYIGTVDAAYRLAFEQAVARWRQVIIGDLVDLFLDRPSGTCNESVPAVYELVDDLLIFVELKEIDGVGNVLGRAGPCLIRNSNSLPVMGFMQFDTADLERMLQNNTLGLVIQHEIGHVLGFGTLWDYLTPPLLEGAGTADPFFNGASAKGYFTQAGGLLINGVPVENTGGDGTRDSHWRETILASELMTGWISAGTNPLSAITIGSLADLGYLVNYQAADSYSVPMGGLWAAARERGIELIEERMPPPQVVYPTRR